MAGDPEDGDPVPGGGHRPDPGVPLILKLIWAAFALWAVVYVATYLVPEFREWSGSR